MPDKTNGVDRQELRNRLFKTKKFKTKTIDLFGTAIELRQPSIGQITALEDADDAQSALVTTLIEYAYIPGTTEKMFEEADAASILEWPVGAWVQDLNAAIVELTSINVPDAEKN